MLDNPEAFGDVDEEAWMEPPTGVPNLDETEAGGEVDEAGMELPTGMPNLDDPVVFMDVMPTSAPGEPVIGDESQDGSWCFEDFAALMSARVISSFATCCIRALDKPVYNYNIQPDSVEAHGLYADLEPASLLSSTRQWKYVWIRYTHRPTAINSEADLEVCRAS